MKKLALSPASVQDLVVVANDRDLLQDLFIYLDYLRDRQVKRMVRTNELPKADSTRLARLMGDPELEQAVKETGGAAWIDFIDRLALDIGLVHYDTEGEYRGYTSSSPSYLDNYVTIVEKKYQLFFNLSPAEQEKEILDTLIVQKKRGDFGSSDNEFYQQSVLGRLDAFSIRGSAVGVMPTLDFTQIRRFLLDLLLECEPGVWYRTASLIAFLKANHPYFLIPKVIKPDRWGRTGERYYNFHDGAERWGYDDSCVPAGAPDAFERVEGRYIERFLEGLPLTLRFVEVAYRPAAKQKVYPSLGLLPAFRVNERLGRLLRGETLPERVTVQPNFDVIVEAELYPARLMQTLAALAERVSALGGGSHASVTTLQLKKERVAAELVRNPGLDVVALLRDLTGRNLPPNVVSELEEWSGHADQFILYEGFGLLESAEPLPQADRFTVERIAPRLRLVRQAGTLVDKLEKASLAPLWVKHDALKFEALPMAAQTVFPKAGAVPVEPAGPRPLLLQRTTQITLRFPDAATFDDFRQALVEARCPIQADAAACTITFALQYQPSFKTVLQQLAEKYQVEIKDLD